MANTLDDLMPKILARGLVTLRKRLVMPGLVNRDYRTEAARRGQTIDVPMPPTVLARDVVPGAVPVATPDITETTVKLDLNFWKEAPLKFTDKEQLEVIDDAVLMATDAAANSLAEAVNASLFAEYPGVFGYVGTAGTTPFTGSPGTYAVATEARKRLNNQKAPLAERRIVIDPDAEEAAINLSAFADSSFAAGGGVILEGDIGRKLGFDWFMDQQVPSHTSTPLTAGAATVNGVHAAGVKTVSIAKATNTSPLVKGDIITIAGDSQTYVVTADVTLAVGNTNVTIEPALQVATAGGEAVALKATHIVNLAFNRAAFALAVRPLSQPQAPGSRVMTMVDSATGLPLRLEISRQHKQDNWSFDILWGTKLVRAELACRIAG
jgi:hypothetical protein